MNPLVQKYGGSSLASLEHIRRVARRIAAAHARGHNVAVVVSAMGKTTSELLRRAQTLSPNPEPRELDMLLSAGERISMSLVAVALREEGLEAISLTGPQAGIRTDSNHFNARIDRVDPERVIAELSRGKVVVVAGYQGLSPTGEVTTLGRGGSDTTAVALAAALNASHCEICSDVDGIYTADPRVVRAAARIDHLSYEDMLGLARHGSRVLNPRAVEYARKTGTQVVAVSTFQDHGGTRVGEGKSEPGHVIGIACHEKLVRIGWRGEAGMETLDEVFQSLDLQEPYQYRISPAYQGLHHELLIPSKNLAEPASCKDILESELGRPFEVDTNVGSVAVIGSGVDSHEPSRRRFARHLSRFDQSTARWVDAPDALACLLPEESLSEAACRLHEDFIESRKREAA